MTDSKTELNIFIRDTEILNMSPEEFKHELARAGFSYGTLFYSAGPLPQLHVYHERVRRDSNVGGWVSIDGGVLYKSGFGFALPHCSAVEKKPSRWKKFLKKAAGAAERLMTNAYVTLTVGFLIGAFVMFSILLAIFKF